MNPISPPNHKSSLPSSWPPPGMIDWNGELALGVSDAIAACTLERAQFGPDTPLPVLDDFRPDDSARLMVQDYAVEHWARAPRFSPPLRRMGDPALAAYLAALRQAVHLPLVPPFADAIAQVIPTVEAEGRRRLRRDEARRRTARDRPSRRTFADIKAAVRLEDEVEALAGPARRSGEHLRFHCPRHPPDRSRDFEVTPALQRWHDFHDGAGGDVIDLWQALGKPLPP